MDFLLHFGPSHYLDLFRCEHPYFSREGRGDAYPFVEAYKKNYGLTNKKGLICIPSGNHDMGRIRECLDCEELKIAFAFLLSMPGAPFIYYGDEIGMRQLKRLSVEGGYSRTGCRTPMQWDDGKNYGFSQAREEDLYIAQDPAPDAPTVAGQMAERDSLWHEIQYLTGIRKKYPALCASGDITFVYCEPEKYPLVYLRSDEDCRILVALNPGKEDVSCTCPYEMKEMIYSLGKGIKPGKEIILEKGILHVPGESAGFMSVFPA